MNRRALSLSIGIAALVLATAPPADAQPATKLVRVGYLTPTTRVELEAAFRQELSRLGYVEGRNLVIEYRSANGQFDRLPALATELVRLNVDVIVANVTQASVAAKAATTTIPIVMTAVADPVGSGLVASLARPGGNVTGSSGANVEVVGKQLELLREIVPGLTRVAALWNPTNAVFAMQQLDEAKSAAARLSIELQVVEAPRPEALEGAFKTIAAGRPGALLVLGDPVLAIQAERIARLAIDHRLPAATGFANYADAGLLVAYGANFEEFYRRAAVYVDRIVKGAKPGDLPVERPTRFELVVNARTAQALGITLSPSLVTRADRVIR